MSNLRMGSERERKKSRRRWLAIAALIGIGCGAAAYGTPRLAAPRCEAAAADYLRAHPVQGQALDGTRAAAGPHDIVGVAEGAFHVRVAYTVPRDLHATLYSHECSTWPWGIQLGPRQAAPLL